MVRSLSQSSRMQEIETPHRASLELESTSVLLALTGENNRLLNEVSRQSGASVNIRGNTIYISGTKDDVGVANRFLGDAAALLAQGAEVGVDDVARSVRELRADPTASLLELLDETIMVS